MTEKQFIEIAKQDYPDRKRINYTTDEQYKAEQIRLKDKRASYIEGLKKGYRLYQEEMYQRLEEVIHKRPCDYLKEMQRFAILKKKMEETSKKWVIVVSDDQLSKDALEGYIERDLGGQLVIGRSNAPSGDEFMLMPSTMFSDVKCGEKYQAKILIIKQDKQ